jgi:phosphohistidine phosphatase SixA
VHQALGGPFDEHDALELLAATSDGGALLLVGHEPTLSDLVQALCGARLEVKKGGLVAMRLGSGRGELLLLLRPHEIELFAEV